MKGKTANSTITITPEEWFEYFKDWYNPKVQDTSSAIEDKIEDILSQLDDSCELCIGDDLYRLWSEQKYWTWWNKHLFY